MKKGIVSSEVLLSLLIISILVLAVIAGMRIDNMNGIIKGLEEQNEQLQRTNEQLQQIDKKLHSENMQLHGVLDTVLPYYAVVKVEYPYRGEISQPFIHHTVQKGDWLSKLSLRYYGSIHLWPRIWKANIDKIDNPDLIFPGQVLNIPL